jgi:hypothetical protein
MSQDTPTNFSISGARVLRSRTAWTLIWFWLFLGALLFLPTPLRDLLRRSGEGADGTAVAQVSSVPGLPAKVVRSSGAAQSEVPDQLVAIEDPRQSLRPFFIALQRTVAKEPGAITRVLHYGDSLIDFDMITGDLRQRLQEHFGDGGHGFTLAAKPWRWYNQRQLGHLEQEEAWDHFRLVGGRVRDGRLGLGCAAIEPRQANAWVQINAAEGARFSRLEVYYLRGPGGGNLKVVVDGKIRGEVSALAPRFESGFLRLELEEAPHTVRLKASPSLRLYGLTLERRGPGITWENLPMISARFPQLSSLDETHWREQLEHRAPQLMVFQFGANDSLSYGGDLGRYGRQVQGVLQMARRSLPRSACLVLGPLDRLERGAREGLHSPQSVQQVAAQQRQAALEAGCAFWSSQQAMGGPGAMQRWLDQGWATKDMVHLNPAGSKVLAQLLERALEAGFQRYLQALTPGHPAVENHALQ